MACYNDKYKHTCSKIVIAVSILMGLMGLASAIFGVVSMGSIPMTSDQKEIFQIPGLTDAGKALGSGMLAVGIVGLMVACLGCFTGAKKNPCFAIPYGLLSFVITIIFLIIGIVSLTAASATGQAAAKSLACLGTATVGGKSVKTGENLALKEQYKKYVDQPMCSIFCPCPQAATNPFVGTDTTYSQSALAKWGRYINAGSSGSNSNAKDYGSTSTPSNNQISAQGLVQLQFADADSKIFTKTYSKYTECFNDVLSKSGKQSSDKNPKGAQQEADTKTKLAKFIKSNGIKILENFEKEYNCAGFCQTPLFYATRSYTERPTQECIAPIFAGFGKIAGMVGIVAIISFLANFCGFCGSFALCTKMEGNDDDK